MYTKVDHIGIAVRSLEAAIPFYRDQLGLHLEAIDEVASQGVRVAFFVCGETLLELLEPTRPDSPIAIFIEKRGEGLHHMAPWVCCSRCASERPTRIEQVRPR